MYRLIVPSPLLFLLALMPVVSFADGDADQVAALSVLLNGHYRSEALLDGSQGPQLSDFRVRVDSPALGEHVLYWQIDTGPDQQTYRQRILVLQAVEGSSKVRQRTWSLVEPERFIGQFHNPELFRDLTLDDLVSELPEDCDPSWQRIADGWRGYTDPERCRIFSERHQDWRHIEAEVEVTASGLRSTERGFDGEGRQLFGTEPGVFIELRRVPEPPSP